MSGQFGDWCYDEETMKNCFCVRFMHCHWGYLYAFEISDRRNDSAGLLHFCSLLRINKQRLVGYNNVGFDYPILHWIIMSNGIGVNAATIYEKAQETIGKSRGPFGAAVFPRDVLIPQIDLFKIHHFDNFSKSTSLKALEFNMRSHSVIDLPFAHDVRLTSAEMDVLGEYNRHDVFETLRFYHHTWPMIEFRDELSAQYGIDFTNFNDTKIGKRYFTMRLEELQPGICYPPGQRDPRQTIRDAVKLSDIIFRYIRFDHPELQRVLVWLKEYTHREGYPEKFPRAIINGFALTFGVGGLHGSVESRSIESTATRAIVDLDVEGFYPSIAIQNQIGPEHLMPLFPVVYGENVDRRKQHKKGTAVNAMLKLANNGVFGDSNNAYSPFLDLQYFLSITINGQLLLSMLFEHIARLPTVEMIQANTDGLTFSIDRDQIHYVDAVCVWWQAYTMHKLERNYYKGFYIRDVNAYIAVGETGKTKRKGPYSWVIGPNLGDGELAWHQDHSALIIPRAVEAVLLEGADLEQFIYGHNDIFDFCLRAKATGGNKLVLEDGTYCQKITRYYISRTGQSMFKIMPPAPGYKVGEFKKANGVSDQLYYSVMREVGPNVWDARIHTKNKSKYDERRTGIEVGHKIRVCNNIADADRSDIDYAYYINAARELLRLCGHSVPPIAFDDTDIPF